MDCPKWGKGNVVGGLYILNGVRINKIVVIEIIY